MTQWLSEDEQRIWRDFITAVQLLEDTLNRDLQNAHGISMGDYEILVRLSESPDRRIRMSILAKQVLVSRSRLSHQIDRMVDAGYVSRETCDDDKRGQFAVMTDKGWKLLVDAAHTHVAGVREHFVDQISDTDYASLGKMVRKIAERLDAGNEVSKIK